ncbi:chromosome partitioning protein ParB [Pseudooceanicola aestuarii]|uniref:chromosome partitioning protein ParB n=1 Tax=Pseudooceanicola aestuarii TaxID=2697319 RepID=UPI0013D729AD|nr:chromosome partitioning protein ParB [Pseudooceanicola aestuarii]
MDSDKPAFSIDLGKLKSRRKEPTPAAVRKTEEVAEKHGFTERAPRRRRGRPASPRTGQVHAKVMPEVSRAIAAEAKRRGVQQGVLIEEAWALYTAQHDPEG